MSSTRHEERTPRRRMRPDDWHRLQVAVVLAMFAIAMVLIVVRLATYG